MKTEGVSDDVIHTLINSLATNCTKAQDSLLNQSALYMPNYGTPTVTPLLVLGGSEEISLAPEAPRDLSIVGGVPPYYRSVTPTIDQKELAATIRPSGNNFTLHIERPSGATADGVAATVFIVDSANSHFDVSLKLILPKKPGETPNPNPLSPTNLKLSSEGGKITVAFDSPKAANVIGYTAIASAKDKNDKHSSEGAKDSKSITIAGCTVSTTYAITVQARDDAGNTATADGGSIPCK